MKQDMKSVRDVLDEVPALGDVGAAVRSGRRRNRTRRAVDVSVAAAASVAVIASVVGVIGHDREPVKPVDQPDTASNLRVPVEVDGAVRDWVSKREMFGAPAPEGTLMVEQCREEQCTHLLVAADGSETDLESVTDGLSDLVTEAGASSVSLSYDATWIALPVSGGMRLQPLTPERADQPIVLEPETPASQWRLVAWGSGSLNATLVEETSDGLPLRYALADLSTGTTNTIRAPQPQTYGPIGHFGIGPLLGLRQTGDSSAGLATVETFVAPLTTDTGWPVGKVAPVSERPTDVAELLSSTETIVNPATGLIEMHTPPGDDEVWPLVTVFGGTTPEASRTGLIEVAGGDSYRLPHATPQDDETLLGATREGTAVLTRAEARRLTVLGRTTEDVLWERTYPGQVTYVIPGLVPPS